MPVVIGLIVGAALGVIAATGAVRFAVSNPPTLPAASSPVLEIPADRTLDV
jgi:hypothetical protein